MKKQIKRIGALVLTGVLALGMSVSALAADTTLGSEVAGVAGARDDSATAQTNSVLILKELKLYNTTGGNIYLPTVGYDYTIASATVANEGTEAGAKITDNSNPTHHVGYVYSGDSDALNTTSASVDFSASTIAGYTADGTAATITQPTAAANAGTAYYGGFSVAFDPAKFDHAGIFRYAITEAEDATNTLAKAGVVHQDTTASGYNNTRFLDVYVRRAVDADTAVEKAAGYVIYGYVLFTGTKDESITYNDESMKTNGFVDAKGGDEYNTYNLVVTKTITGTLADTSHKFPFQVVFKSPNQTAATIHYTAINGLPTSATTATVSKSETTTIGKLADDSTLKLSNNGNVTFYGLPAGVTATVQENNDTFDVYTAKATITAKTAQTYTENQIGAGQNATIIPGLDNATTTEAVGSADTTTAWTNDMAIVSPTGVALRFAPYAVILAAGLALLFVRRRRRADDEE